MPRAVDKSPRTHATTPSPCRRRRLPLQKPRNWPATLPSTWESGICKACRPSIALPPARCLTHSGIPVAYISPAGELLRCRPCVPTGPSGSRPSAPRGSPHLHAVTFCSDDRAALLTSPARPPARPPAESLDHWPPAATSSRRRTQGTALRRTSGQLATPASTGSMSGTQPKPAPRPPCAIAAARKRGRYRPPAASQAAGSTRRRRSHAQTTGCRPMSTRHAHRATRATRPPWCGSLCCYRRSLPG